MLSFCGMLIFFQVSMDSETEYNFFGGGICHRNSYSIKKYRCYVMFCYVFHSFLYSFIVPSYSP